MKTLRLALIFTALLVVLLAAACNPEPTPSSAPASTAQPTVSTAEMRAGIIAAFRSQSTLAYRQVSDTVLQDGTSHHTVIEFMPPSSYHIVSDGTTELLVIGDKVYLKQDGAWQSLAMSAGDIIDLTFADRLEKNISDVKDLGADTLNGAATHIYSFKATVRSGGAENLVEMKVWLSADQRLVQSVHAGSTAAMDTATSKVSSVPSTTTSTYTFDPSIKVSAPGN